MTIHHDKLAYGKLGPATEELSDEKIAEMLKSLPPEPEKNSDDDKPRKQKIQKNL